MIGIDCYMWFNVSYNIIMFNMTQERQWYSVDQNLNSQQTPHSSASRVSYAVFIISIMVDTDHNSIVAIFTPVSCLDMIFAFRLSLLLEYHLPLAVINLTNCSHQVMVLFGSWGHPVWETGEVYGLVFMSCHPLWCHIETWTRWPLFSRRHFLMHFLNEHI